MFSDTRKQTHMSSLDQLISNFCPTTFRFEKVNKPSHFVKLKRKNRHFVTVLFVTSI